MFHFIITGQSGQGAARTLSVILYVYFLQFKPKESFHLLQQHLFVSCTKTYC